MMFVVLSSKTSTTSRVKLMAVVGHFIQSLRRECHDITDLALLGCVTDEML
jgi:hypothetical protein